MLAKSIQRELRRLSDARIAEHSERFFKTGPGEYGEDDRFLGIRVPELRRAAKQYKALSITEAEKLLHSEFHEERLLTLLLLVEQYRGGDDAKKQHIFDLYLNNTPYINNWDLVDSSAPHIVGPHLFRRSKQPLFDLAKSEDLWEKRIATMACFYFIRQRQFSVTLKILKILLHDKEELIHKAVGWMLREIGNRDITVEERFLVKRYHTMPRTMLRYAIEKFPEHRRQRYLKGEV